MADYIIVLFKNKERYKIIKNYKTYKKSLDFFNKEIQKSNDVVFNIQTENGKTVKYEIGLLEKNSKKLTPIYKIDELGRNIPIELNDPEYSILKIEDYKFDEKIFDLNKKKRVDSSKFIKLITQGNELKLISKLNNKIIVQIDENFSLYSLKSSSDSERFLDALERHIINLNKRNCLIVKDSSREQRKYMYDILSNLGYNKGMLYRKSTTHSKDK
jgi:hypothetical protein